MTTAGVQIGLLGPLRVIVDGTERAITGPVRRALLAVLALHPGEVVGLDRLSDLIWDGAPPATAQNALRVHVSHLRKMLGRPELIEWAGTGYRLAIAPDDVDITGFEQHARSGRQALASGDLEAAHTDLHAADDLWRGMPLADVRSGADADVERLLTLRSELNVDLAEHRMRTQGAGADTSELSALTVERPYDERVWHLLITAQYWNGRQADALATYQRAVQALDDELGIDPTPALRRLQEQILRHDPALDPPRTADVHLPAFPTSFIGRGQAIETLTDLLHRNRLLTLTGLGGVGKTRLAVAVAEAVADRFSHGITFVSFSEVEDPAVVPSVVASHLEASGADADDVASAIDARDLLLVLDGAEQVAESVAQLASTLLAACPRVRLLVTSRVPLRVVGEQVWVTPPLAVAAEDGVSEAAELFLERASQQVSGAGLPEADDPHLREAVELVGGLPLAIELAAAQCSVLTVADVVDRLRRTMEAAAPERDRPQRHHSMQAALMGTLEHLEPAARVLAGRLTVFRSPVGIAAIEAVCTDDLVPADDVPLLLRHLVKAAVVVADVSQERGRYSLLPPVRRALVQVLPHFGHEPEDLAHRHLEHLGAVVQQAAAAVFGPAEASAMGELDEIAADLRAALKYAAEQDPARGLTMATGLSPYWLRRRRNPEGRRWLRQLLDRGGGVDESVRAGALHAGGGLAWDDGDREEAEQMLQEALQIRTRLEDHPGRALTLNNLAGLASDRGEHDRAYRMWGTARELFVDSGHEVGAASCELNLGIAAQKLGRLDDAVVHLEAACTAFAARGATTMEATALERLAGVQAERGQYRHAMTLIRSAQAIYDDVGTAEQRARMVWLRALRHRDLGDEGAAHEHIRAAAQAVVADELIDAWWVSGLIETAAALAARTDPEHAAGLLGAARTHRERHNHGADSATVTDLPGIVAHLGEVLGPQHLTEEMAIGAFRPVTAVIAAIAGIRADASRPLHKAQRPRGDRRAGSSCVPSSSSTSGAPRGQEARESM